MKVKLLKDHLDGKAGDVLDVTEERANYWISTGVAEIKKENKELKFKLEKK